MNASLKLGRIRGITIGIHYTWLIVFGLLTYSLASGVFPSLYDGWSTAAYWIVGAIASLLLFASVLAHELGHSFVALSKGIAVPSITLFIFGGVATISQESESAGDEFQIAIAGPAVSLLVAIVSFVIWFLAGGASEYVAATFEYLALANLLLVVFNLIPGFPLDGGRVFRSIVWGITHSVERATRIASTLGVIIGFIFIVGGIFLVFSNPISGIWLVAIGWFLHSAAEQSYQQFRMQQSFGGVRVDALMDPHPIVVNPDVSLLDIVERYILGQSVRGMPVVENGRLIGIITLTDIRQVPREEWNNWMVRERMTPAERLVTTTPDARLEVALQAMAQQDIHQVPVVQGEELVGVLTRNAIIQFLQLRQQLPEAGPEIARQVRKRSSITETGAVGEQPADVLPPEGSREPPERAGHSRDRDPA